MKISNTSKRLKQLMIERNLKQVDILRLTLPYCEKYGVKMNKSDISQYVSGKVEPNQDKLFVLSNALKINEAWLMGYDAPMERNEANAYIGNVSADTVAFEITGRSLKYSPIIFNALCNSLTNIFSNTDDSVVFTNGKRQISNILELMYDSSVSYDDKATMLRSIIEIVLYDTKKETLSIHYFLDKSRQNDQLSSIQEIALNKAFSKLNYSGRKKVIDYATDLSCMPIYTVSSENSTLYADAANPLEDASAEDKQHDDDIMNDENF